MVQYAGIAQVVYRTFGGFGENYWRCVRGNRPRTGCVHRVDIVRGIAERRTEYDHPDVNVGRDGLLDRPRDRGRTGWIGNRDNDHGDHCADHNVVSGESVVRLHDSEVRYRCRA